MVYNDLMLTMLINKSQWWWRLFCWMGAIARFTTVTNCTNLFHEFFRCTDNCCWKMIYVLNIIRIISIRYSKFWGVFHSAEISMEQIFNFLEPRDEINTRKTIKIEFVDRIDSWTCVRYLKCTRSEVLLGQAHFMHEGFHDCGVWLFDPPFLTFQMSF